MNVRYLNNKRSLLKEVELIGANRQSYSYFHRKDFRLRFKVYDLAMGAANILKQELLARGGDLVVHHDIVSGKKEKTDAIIVGNLNTINFVIEKLEALPYWNLSELREELIKQVRNIKKDKFTLRLPNEKTIVLDEKPMVMGIVNITNDSFYPSSRINDEEKLLERVRNFINNGAEILDIGGESTRPGAEKVSLEEELRRVIPAIKIIRKHFSIPISIDTYKAQVAREALDAGADIINDISGLQFDKEMVLVARDYGVPVIINHIQGKPEDMQDKPKYRDVIEEITDFFDERINFCINNGLKKEQIILDPGIGFGKRLEDNLQILKYTDEFKIFGLPILIGASRKTLIKNVLELDVDERLEGTLAITACALQKGAHIIRVHDVKENKRVIDMMLAIRDVE